MPERLFAVFELLKAGKDVFCGHLKILGIEFIQQQIGEEQDFVNFWLLLGANGIGRFLDFSWVLVRLLACKLMRVVLHVPSALFCRRPRDLDGGQAFHR